jgi:myo-inositol 2-dehydrogenase/D-chiro-inositol 1-dehydrogenase
MISSELTVGLIGAGRIGKLHAEHLRGRIPRANLKMVADIDENAAKQCAAHVGACDASTDYREVLDHPGIQAVVICSSTDTHARLIEEAAAVGKHIFCEKPIDHDLDRIDRALAAIERAGVLLQIGFNRRFDANFRRVKEAVESGEIGTPHLMHIISRDPAPPPIEYIEKSGGLFLDMTIHDLDMSRFLISSEVDEIYAAGAVRVDPAIGAAGDLDTSVIVLKFANGVIGTIDNSRQAVYGYDQRVEVFGSGGSVSSGNNYPNAATIRGRESVYRDLPLNFFIERYTDSYLEEMTQFVDAVLTGGPSPLDGAEGRIPVVMAQAAWKSYQENRPVKLTEIGRNEV